jgi:HEAT repeat protein
MPGLFQVRGCLRFLPTLAAFAVAWNFAVVARAQPQEQPRGSVAELVEALKSKDPNAQLAAAILLGDLAKNEKPGPILDPIRDAGSALIPLTTSPDERVRIAAIEAIGEVRPRLNLGVEWINLAGSTFAKTIKDKSPAVRLATVRAIGAHSSKALQDASDATTVETRFPLMTDMIDDASDTAPTLAVALSDSSSDVRAGALDAAVQMVTALANLSQFFSGRDMRPAEAQLQRLSERLPGFTRALEPLLAAAFASLATGGPEQRMAAAHVVEQGAELVRKHRGRSTDDIGMLQSALLAEGGQEAAKSVIAALQRGLPALVGALGDSAPAVRLAALDAFEALGRSARQATPALIQAASDSDRFVRWAAVRTLGKVDEGDQREALEALAARLHDVDYEVRRATLDCLALIGPKIGPIIPALETVLRETDVDLQLAALKTLKDAGPQAKAAVPALIHALKDRDVRVRREAPVILGGLGQDAKAAAPALQVAVQDADPEVRVAAAQALLAILRPARPANAAPVAR